MTSPASALLPLTAAGTREARQVLQCSGKRAAGLGPPQKGAHGGKALALLGGKSSEKMPAEVPLPSLPSPLPPSVPNPPLCLRLCRLLGVMVVVPRALPAALWALWPPGAPGSAPMRRGGLWPALGMNLRGSCWPSGRRMRAKGAAACWRRPEAGFGKRGQPYKIKDVSGAWAALQNKGCPWFLLRKRWLPRDAA